MKESPGTPKRNIGQAEIESSLYKYDGTFSDHLEMLVQMGYVVLFSAAFPLAGLCALANNLLEIRSDAFKLAHVHQVNFFVYFFLVLRFENYKCYDILNFVIKIEAIWSASC